MCQVVLYTFIVGKLSVDVEGLVVVKRVWYLLPVNSALYMQNSTCMYVCLVGGRGAETDGGAMMSPLLTHHQPSVQPGRRPRWNTCYTFLLAIPPWKMSLCCWDEYWQRYLRFCTVLSNTGIILHVRNLMHNDSYEKRNVSRDFTLFSPDCPELY